MFAYAAAQVKHMLEVTQRLGGENYVLWGGREGYDTLLNTDLTREGDQLARFLHLVAEHKHRIGFEGPLLIEPKPMEPTKHQYDYDSATVHGFLVRNGLEGEYRAEHRGQPRDARRPHRSTTRSRTPSPTGSWAASTPTAATRRTAGTPTSSRTRSRTSRCRCTRSCAAAASRTGGFNFDAKLRRQSTDRTDLFHAHIGGIDTLARALLVAADLLEQRRRWRRRSRTRYAGWDGALGHGDPRRHASRSPTSRRRSRPARSTRRRVVGQPGAAREPRQPGDLGGRPAPARPDPMGVVLGIDVSTTATKAVLIDERARSLAIGVVRVRVRAAAPALERAGPAAVVGRRDRRRSGGRWPSRGVDPARRRRPSG